MIAEPDPDIRGWKVVLTDGQPVGKVDDVIVDTSDMTVRYLEVSSLPRNPMGKLERERLAALAQPSPPGANPG